jgi:hypothetical protein
MSGRVARPTNGGIQVHYARELNFDSYQEVYRNGLSIFCRGYRSRVRRAAPFLAMRFPGAGEWRFPNDAFLNILIEK